MPSRYDFSGRVALVTGAAQRDRARGRPSACSRAAGRLRSSTCAPTLAAATASELGALAVPAANVARSDEVDAAVARVESELGRLDVLVCCAGVSGDSLRTEDVSDAEWERVFAVNCHGVFYCNRAVIPGMTERGYGRIVNIASIAGKEGNPMAAAYSASKAAVIAMTKAIGKDLVDTGIRVSSIAPAVSRRRCSPDSRRSTSTTWSRSIPLGTAGPAGGGRGLVCFLASEDTTSRPAPASTSPAAVRSIDVEGRMRSGPYG